VYDQFLNDTFFLVQTSCVTYFLSSVFCLTLIVSTRYLSGI